MFVDLRLTGSRGVVTLLGRENKLISSKVDIDADPGRGEQPDREGGGGGGGGKLACGICLILNCKICGT